MRNAGVNKLTELTNHFYENCDNGKEFYDYTLQKIVTNSRCLNFYYIW